MDDEKNISSKFKYKKNINPTLESAGEERSADLYKAPYGSV